jgi:Fanconi anemia group M protein
MELAIFYEPVASEIRSIQRRGRVGRTKVGRIIILIAKGTRDEAYYWSAQKKEGIMKRTLYEMKGESGGSAPSRSEVKKKPEVGQSNLSDF